MGTGGSAGQRKHLLTWVLLAGVVQWTVLPPLAAESVAKSAGTAQKEGAGNGGEDDSAGVETGGSPEGQASAESSTKPVAASTSRRSGQDVEEIIIEGERLDSTLQESTHSITVFNSKMLRRSTDRTLDELLVRVPNVTVDPFGNTPVIRGLAQTGISTQGFAGAIPNFNGFMDGFYTPTAQPIWDASQVEILKGTQNFLGGGSYGGMTSVSSNRGDEDNQVYSSFIPRSGERLFGIGFGGPVTESVDYRTTAYIRRADGLMHNLAREDENWKELVALNRTVA